VLFSRWPRISSPSLLITLLIIMSACALEPADDRPATATLTTAPQSDTHYVTGAETPLRECPERSCAIISVAPDDVSLPIVTRHDKGSDYWLEVEYDHQRGFIGPFMPVSITYSYPPGTARTCPNRDCPVRFNIPLTDHVLSLDVIVTNLVEHWTRTAYNGEVVYLGPWIPPPSNSVWETTIIPASETARALGTLMPSATLPSATAATLVLTPTP
jgi:hypothetical protein